MKFLPFENYVLMIKLSADEVYKRLFDNIEAKKGLRFFSFNHRSTKPYEGEISGNMFIINRIIDYRNSFRPVITGQISTFAGQTQINVKMGLSIPVLIFISFWLGTLGLVCMGMLLIGLLQIKEILQQGFPPELLIPFGMFIFGYLVIYIAFKVESIKSKEFLATLLDAEEIN